MTADSAAVLERLLRDNDLGWMIDMYAPREGAIPYLLEQLSAVTAEFQRRFGHEVSFAPESLAAEADRNPHKVAAFLQALAASRSPEMLVMVWRILQGLSIRDVTMAYHEWAPFNLNVTLARPGGEQDSLETYQTTDINDAALLRHFGIMTLGDKPLFDGFFPLPNS